MALDGTFRVQVLVVGPRFLVFSTVSENELPLLVSQLLSKTGHSWSRMAQEAVAGARHRGPPCREYSVEQARGTPSAKPARRRWEPAARHGETVGEEEALLVRPLHRVRAEPALVVLR